MGHHFEWPGQIVPDSAAKTRPVDNTTVLTVALGWVRLGQRGKQYSTSSLSTSAAPGIRDHRRNLQAREKQLNRTIEITQCQGPSRRPLLSRRFSRMRTVDRARGGAFAAPVVDRHLYERTERPTSRGFPAQHEERSELVDAEPGAVSARSRLSLRPCAVRE